MSAMLRMTPVVLISLLVAAMCFGAFAAPAFAADGKAVFESLRCDSCHKPAEKTVAVPLAQIAKTYGAPDQLLKYFKGESKAMIETEKPGMMKGQLPKIAARSDEEKNALAEYILSFK